MSHGMAAPLPAAPAREGPRRSKWDEATPKQEEVARPPASSKRSKWDAPAPQADVKQQEEPDHVVEEQIEHARRGDGVRLAKYTTLEELDLVLPSKGYEVLVPPGPPKKRRKVLQGAEVEENGQADDGLCFRIGEEVTDRERLLGKGGDAAGLGTVPGDPRTLELQDKLGAAGVEEDSVDASILKLLWKVRTGTPHQRKNALRQLSDRARSFGANALLTHLLPMLMDPALEEHERHLLVKVVDRVLLRLDELVRPFVHQILVVIEPLLIDEDYYARVEGRQVISNLAKAAGIASMIASMRPDIDNPDEYVRNTTARAFSVVASALGISSLLPFLKAVCRSKKSWQARHTGIKVIQQTSILVGCGVLPHLRAMLEIVEPCLLDENVKVRTVSALAIGALAEAAAPYGGESFENVLSPLWEGLQLHRGKVLSAFIKAASFVLPLLDHSEVAVYAKGIMEVCLREFRSTDDEMRRSTLQALRNCISCEQVDKEYLSTTIMPPFLQLFWVQRTAIDRRMSQAVAETTVSLAGCVGCKEIMATVAKSLKDNNEWCRKMGLETLDKMLPEPGIADLDLRAEELLLDGVLFAFQEQVSEGAFSLFVKAFTKLLVALQTRAKPYLPQICGILKWRLNHKSATVRLQAADLIGNIIPILKICHEEELLRHFGVILYEYLGEEYPDVLGSTLNALCEVVRALGVADMSPPIKDLFQRLLPILKNRHEKVQENCINLVGIVAREGAEIVSAREWIRVCFELLDSLKAPKKRIRRAAVNTFGYIAQAVGPQDVLSTLLNNLKVQERQNRVCTTVAIAIVAESCSPFTVLPALINEYRTPEINIQNGVLKSLSFLFEYIGEAGKDYVYAVTPLLVDALVDRDPVHRQIASNAIRHISLGVSYLGCEDALLHMLNYLWPNIFESSPHVIIAVSEAITSLQYSVGPGVVLRYLMQGLFHPSRDVRQSYWRLFNDLFIAWQDALGAFYPGPVRRCTAHGSHFDLDVFV
eukprot:scaffold944_cov333-Pavlova_lutheri.AAC.2